MVYLAGTLITAGIWSVLYFHRRDIRKDILWSSWYFLFIMTVGFIAMKLTISISDAQSINPGYWNPDSLFDLNSRTGGYGIEDGLFMFFIGGIAAVIYEELFRRHIRYRYIRHRPHHAVLIGVIAAALVALTGVNLIYAVIAFGLAGALSIWIARRDLIVHSLLGGVSFLVVYICAYLLILLFYPEFVAHHYNLDNISSILLIGLPLEEYAFALTLGFRWSPLYEYAKDRR